MHVVNVGWLRELVVGFEAGAHKPCLLPSIAYLGLAYTFRSILVATSNCTRPARCARTHLGRWHEPIEHAGHECVFALWHSDDYEDLVQTPGLARFSPACTA
jgi:hypothetical protein